MLTSLNQQLRQVATRVACRAQPAATSDRVVERVAVLELAAVEAALEPGHALLRRAVVEAFGNDIALHLLLQRVVADLLRGVQRLFEIALFQDALLRQ